MHAEVLSIGSEILLGDVVDTNSAFVARRLGAIGVPVRYQGAVDDHRGRIREVLALALQRSPVIIATGGIGPTADDLTREVAAEVLGVPLEFHPELLAQIEERFQRLRMPMTPNNRQQAYIPAGSLPIENPKGTAPGFISERRGHYFVALPGVPTEMAFLLDSVVLEFLQKRLGLRGLTVTRTLKVASFGESRVDQLIRDLVADPEGPAVGLLAQGGETHVRVTGRGEDLESVERAVAVTCKEVVRRLGARVYGADEESLEGVVGGLLARRALSLAVVERGSGGFLTSRLAAVSGSGEFFRGGVVLPPGSTRILSALFPETDIPAPQSGSSAEEPYWKLMADFQASGAVVLEVEEGKDGAKPQARHRVHLLFLGPWGSVSKEYSFAWPPPTLWQRAGTAGLEILRRILLVGSPDLP